MEPAPPISSPLLKRLSSSSSPKIQPKHLSPEEVVISDADALFIECEAYITQAKSSLAVLPFSAINEWRTRRRDDHLVTLLDQIQPRIQGSEKALRDVIERTTEKKEMLRRKAKDLQKQLCSCIEWNKEQLSKSEPIVDTLRHVVDTVANESSCVKFMLQFNDEISRQRQTEDAIRERNAISQSQAPWRSSINENGKEGKTEDEDHVTLSGKLSSLRTMREKTMSELALVLEYKETCTQNMTGCSRSKDAVEQILRRDNVTTKEGQTAASVDMLQHSQFCKDCANVFQKGESVIAQFDDLQNTSGESTKRLQKLVEIRERILEIEEMGPGSVEGGSN